MLCKSQNKIKWNRTNTWWSLSDKKENGGLKGFEGFKTFVK
jgi:hypothetical protein